MLLKGEMVKTINVAEDFSLVPSGRFDTDGPNNGTAFRRKFLVPALNAGYSVVIDIDGLLSYANSFFEEAIVGLCRSVDEGGEGFSLETVSRSLSLKAGSDVGKFWLPTILRLFPSGNLQVTATR